MNRARSGSAAMSDCRKRMGIFAGALLVSSCAAALAPTGDDAAASHADREAYIRSVAALFPADEYLVGIGQSAITAEAAETNAIADAAAAIRSSIARNLIAYQAEQETSGVRVAGQRVMDEVKLKVESDAGAHLRANREFTRLVRGEYRAVAAVRRAELDSRYVEEARETIRRLEHWYDRIVATRDLVSCAQAWCEATRQEGELHRRSMERWVVSRRSLWTPELRERGRRAFQALQDAKAAFPVVVAGPSARATGDSSPASAIVERLRAEGWPAHLTRDPPCKGPGGMELRTRRVDDCRRIQLGVFLCAVRLTVEGRRCGDEAVLFSVSRNAQAMDMSADGPARARNAALRRIPSGELAEEAADRALWTLGATCR